VTGVLVTGWSAISAAGVGAAALAPQAAGAPLPVTAAVPGARAGQLNGDPHAEPLPSPAGYALGGFDVREHIGRRGTSSYDRVTGLAVVCCRDALAAAGGATGDTGDTGDIGEDSRRRVGVALGTSLGSFKSTSDYTRETLVQDRPYLVNPMLFPNTVMNCAAGQVAIRLGLRGVNATIAGGALAFLNAMRFAANVIARGYADVMLAGAAEEFTAHRAWASRLTSPATAPPAGEAAGVFVLTGTEPPGWADGRGVARILAVATGYGPGGGAEADRALRGCVHRVLRRSGADPASVGTVFTGETADNGETGRPEYGPASDALGHKPRRVAVPRLLGDCGAATGAMALGLVLTAGGEPGGLSLLTGRSPDGAVGVAIVTGRTDGRSDHDKEDRWPQ
jgi:3-oxoacyl-[acyl-carrier-protein] synthase II